MGMPSIWEAEARDNKFEVSLDYSYSLLSKKKSEEKERIVFKDTQQQKPIGFDLECRPTDNIELLTPNSSSDEHGDCKRRGCIYQRSPSSLHQQ